MIVYLFMYLLWKSYKSTALICDSMMLTLRLCLEASVLVLVLRVDVLLIKLPPSCSKTAFSYDDVT